MKLTLSAALALSVTLLVACGPKVPHTSAALAWAYPKAAQAPFPPGAPGPQHVAGSPLTFSLEQAADDENPPDWFPGEHPALPQVVAHGRKGLVAPCGSCHDLNGQGFLGAPNLAGLPASYIIEQVAEFRSGRRLSAEAGRPATQEMVKEATGATDAEVASAAAYYASLSRAPWIRVVETDKAPVTRPNYYGWLDLAPVGGTEPIAGRVIEVAEDFQRMMIGDPHSGVVVHVPRGAHGRGEALVRSGGPGGQACKSCHGPDLKGGTTAPPLAGRSAAYLARMLWDIKTGARNGSTVAQMQTPVRALNEAQITDIVVYLASLKP